MTPVRTEFIRAGNDVQPGFPPPVTKPSLIFVLPGSLLKGPCVIANNPGMQRSACPVLFRQGLMPTHKAFLLAIILDLQNIRANKQLVKNTNFGETGCSPNYEDPTSELLTDSLKCIKRCRMKKPHKARLYKSATPR